jgi:pyruvate dehydrogenase E1 component alpha subunit
MNLATCWKLPVIFITENNLYGISCCTTNSMCVADIADRAAAYDMPGVVVDGNNVVAVYETAFEAVRRAREGKGPTLVECKTYRWRGHFEGDPCTYRRGEELQEWKKKDPIELFEKKLLDMGILSQSKIEEIKSSHEQELAEAVGYAEQSALPDPSELTEDVYTIVY